MLDGVKRCFLGGTSGKEPTCNAGYVRNVGSILRSGRFPGEGHRNPLQYSCLENPMDRGAWWVTVHRVAKSRTWLKQLRIAQHTHSWMRGGGKRHKEEGMFQVKKSSIKLDSRIVFSYKKEWNIIIFSNMDGPRDYHAKRNKPDRKRQISYNITYMWNLKKLLEMKLFMKQK